MIERMRELFRDEEGASMVEYALLLGLIAVVAIVTLSPLGQTVKKMFGDADSAINPPAPQ